MRPSKRYAFFIGFTSVLVQLIAIRELVTSFGGNELYIAFSFASWMSLIIIGIYVASKINIADPEALLKKSFLLTAFFAPLTIILSQTLPSILTVHGMAPTIIQSVIATLTSLGLFCMLYGSQILLISRINEKHKKIMAVSTTYVWDTFGDVVGALCFTLILSPLFAPFNLSLICSFFALIAYKLYSQDLKTTIISVFILLLIGFVIDVPNIINPLVYPGQEVLRTIHTPYSEITLTQMSGQMMVWQNKQLITESGFTHEDEQKIVIPITLANNTEDVLIIGGGLASKIRLAPGTEIGNVDYVEIDPLLPLMIIDSMESYNKGQTNIIKEDGRRYLRYTDKRYDAILIDVGVPDTLLKNRYYTIEFFNLVKKRMKQDGLLAVYTPAVEDYMGPEESGLNSQFKSDLQSVFKFVWGMPVGQVIWIAKEIPFEIDPLSELGHKGFGASFFSSQNTPLIISKERRNWFSANTQIKQRSNTDLWPRANLLSIEGWTKKNDPLNITGWILWSILLIYLILLIKLEPVDTTLMNTGFSLMSIQMVVIYLFQTFYGYVLNHLGLLVASVMAGMGVGALYADKHKKTAKRNLFKNAILLGLSCLLSPAILIIADGILSPHIGIVVAYVLYPAALFSIGHNAGRIFAYSELLKKYGATKNTALLFGLDYIGAIIAALVVGTYLLPTYGVVHTVIAVSATTIVCLYKIKNA